MRDSPSPRGRCAAGWSTPARRSPRPSSRGRWSGSRWRTATAGSPRTPPPSTCSRPRAAWCSATSTTPTARPGTSRASAAPAARWWASCPTPSAPTTPCSAPPTAPASSLRSPPRPPARPEGRHEQARQAEPERGRVLRPARPGAEAEAPRPDARRSRGGGAAHPLHEVPEVRGRPGHRGLRGRPARPLPRLPGRLAGCRRAGAPAPAPGPERAGPDRLRRPEGPERQAGRVTRTADLRETAVPFPGDPPVTPALVAEHNLNALEYERIEAMLGRAPTLAELGVFSALWSEHCSYKHSKPVLRTFPTTGPRVLQGPGENAGVLRLEEGWAVAFKIESHNHPSAV